MTTATTTRPLTVALIGNPNTGKSTLFNALSGMRVLTGNYPGVTVEKHVGQTRIGETALTLIDLPGTYSLAPRTLDEMVTVDVLLGRLAESADIDVVMCIVDASNLERNLYLVTQVLDLGLPTIVVLNMSDVAESRGFKIDAARLGEKLGAIVVRTEAHRKRGLDELKQAVVDAAQRQIVPRPTMFPPAFEAEYKRLSVELERLTGAAPPRYLVERLLLDVGGFIESNFPGVSPAQLAPLVKAARDRLAAEGCKTPAVESQARYAWIRQALEGGFERPRGDEITVSDRIDGVLTHWFSGPLVFLMVMFAGFQAISTLAAYFMEWCEAGQGAVSGLVEAGLGPGILRSMLVDGVVAGVGGVLIFLPQIVILFLFIALLEDCGYMARAAYLMDRLMTQVGLSGKSFVPLMSSFACAIPGVMATRVIENRRDRMTTMLVAPLMSCSARYPVYLLMIAAFVPAIAWAGGWIKLHGIVLFLMTFLGAFVAIPIAWLLKKTLFKGETPPFVMEMPAYKWPSPRLVFNRVWTQAWSFVSRAGTLIFATSLLIWAAGYFPGSHAEADAIQRDIEQTQNRVSVVEGQLERLKNADADKSGLPALEKTLETETARLDSLQPRINAESQRLLEASFLGTFGKFIEPAVRPLGWDWKIGVGVVASFPAREVIISTLGTIYSLGGGVDEEDSGLQTAIRDARWPDGRKVYNLPVALSIMVFFALCAQCASTLMVIGRETNSWQWPLATFTYMTVLAYVAAWVTYRVALLMVA